PMTGLAEVSCGSALVALTIGPNSIGFGLPSKAGCCHDLYTTAHVSGKAETRPPLKNVQIGTNPMLPLEIALLSVAAFCTSALTAVVGAGGGTALIALMLQLMTPAAAIPVHGAVQLASNTARAWMLRKHMAWPIIVRFASLMPFGVALGLLLFQGLPTEVVQILIGCFVLISLATRQLKMLENKDLPLWAFVPVGFVTGVLNMIVGVIAPILGVLVIRKELTKESVVGTLSFFGFIGNLLKIAGFTLVGFSFRQYGLVMLCMVPAAIAGTHIGGALLSNMSERYFRLVFRLMLIALALKLIVYDGLVHLIMR
ncbi:MAG TPA: sulfite exporter TauE/SafE family protein, partial [Burkholderiales bacterium]|nr:sulfite exporter TauE/SafE family protein [Burkholderiales bacterium]